MTSLRQVAERVRNVPGLGRDLIVIAVLVSVGMLSTGYIFSQYGWHTPWQDRFTFTAEFTKAAGVRPQSRQEVRIAGVPVGEIEAAEPGPGGTARLEMSLDPGHTVYSDARAVLRTKTPINIMYVALNPGGPPAKPLPEGGTIPVSQTERPTQPYEVLNKLDERAQSALTSLVEQSDIALAEAPARLPDGLRETAGTLGSLKPVVTQLRSRRKTIGELVTAMSQIATAAGGDNQRLARLATSMQQTLSVLSGRDEELGATLAELPGFANDLDRAVTKTSALTGQLDPTLDGLHRASERLPDALSRLRGTVGSAGEVIRTATPVVQKAKPVVADLRPLAGDLSAALGDLAPVTAHLPSATQRIVPWMSDLAAFVYQTSSVFSLSDVNGGLGRGNFALTPLEGKTSGGGKNGAGK